jgi:hypothetical protein
MEKGIGWCTPDECACGAGNHPCQKSSEIPKRIGLFEEVERKLSAISQEEWDELCRKLFKYD